MRAVRGQRALQGGKHRAHAMRVMDKGPCKEEVNKGTPQ